MPAPASPRVKRVARNRKVPRLGTNKPEQRAVVSGTGNRVPDELKHHKRDVTSDGDVVKMMWVNGSAKLTHRISSKNAKDEIVNHPSDRA